MRCFLGVDAGGSKCDAILADADGQVLGWGRNDPIAASVVDEQSNRGIGRSAEAASSAIRKAMGPTITACSDLHAAGLEQHVRSVLQTYGSQGGVTHHPFSEFDAALSLAGESCGVVALVGTGAFVAGRTRDGKAVHLDGMGPLLGDWGGGFMIGLAALRAAARSAWHPRHETALAGALPQFKKRKAGDPYNPVGYMFADHDRSEIASYASIVNSEADRGDRVAKEILQDAAAELASTALDVAARLGIAQESYAIVGVGGVIANSSIYWDHLCSRVNQFAPRWTASRSRMPAAMGYVLLAAKGVAGIDFESFRTRLLSSAAEKGLGKEDVK